MPYLHILPAARDSVNLDKDGETKVVIISANQRFLILQQVTKILRTKSNPIR